MSALDCLGSKLAIMIQKRNVLSAHAEEGSLSKGRAKELDDAIRAFEGYSKETADLVNGLKGKYGADSVNATKLAVQEAHEIMSQRLAFKARNTMQTAAKAKSDAQAILSSVQRGVKVDDAIQAKYYGGYRPGNMVPREMFADLSFGERQAANRALLDGGISKAFDETKEPMLKLIQRGEYNDQVGKAYFDIINNTTTEGVTKEALTVAKKLFEQTKLWEGKLNDAGVYTRTKDRRLASTDISARAAQGLGKDGFLDLMNSNLWWERIADAAEMPKLLTDGALQQNFLSHIFDHISTGGKVKVGDWAPFRDAGTSTIMNNRGHQGLVLVKDFQSWKNIHEKVGATDFFIQHTSSNAAKVARDLASSESFGGSPTMYVSNIVKELMKDSPKLSSEVKESMMKYLQIDFAPQGDWLNVNEFFRSTVGTLANQSRSSLLGNIAQQSMMEPLSSAAGRHIHGLPVMKLFFNTLTETFNPKLNSDRELAARLGKEVYAWMDSHMENPRNKELSMLEKFGAWGTSATMKYTGGQRVTHASRKAAVRATEDMIMDWADGVMPNARFKQYMDHFFLTDADKGLIQKYRVEDGHSTGSKQLDLESMYSSKDPAAQNLAQRLASQFNTVQQIAAPDRSPVYDKFFDNMARNGVWGAIGSRSLRTFTGFVGGMHFYQMKPILSLKGPEKYAYVAAQTMSMVTMGAIYVQLMRLASGKDLLPIGPELAGRAALAAPFGMYGAFIAGGVNDGWNIGDLSAVTRALQTHAKLPANIISDLYNGKRPDTIGKDLANIFRFWTPGSTTWFGRHLLDKYAYDQLEYLIDGEAATKRWNQQRKREIKAGSDMFITRGPGTPVIDRAPDLSKATNINIGKE